MSKDLQNYEKAGVFRRLGPLQQVLPANPSLGRLHCYAPNGKYEHLDSIELNPVGLILKSTLPRPRALEPQSQRHPSEAKVPNSDSYLAQRYPEETLSMAEASQRGMEAIASWADESLDACLTCFMQWRLVW